MKCLIFCTVVKKYTPIVLKSDKEEVLLKYAAHENLEQSFQCQHERKRSLFTCNTRLQKRLQKTQAKIPCRRST